jgi:hypothetical protein
MRYKASRDIPKFAQKYKTMVPSKLASFISLELNRRVSSQSVRVWLKRHPTTQKKLADYINSKQVVTESTLNQKVLAEFSIAGIEIAITDLDTLDLAKRYLEVIEDDLKKKICCKANLKVINRKKGL